MKKKNRIPQIATRVLSGAVLVNVLTSSSVAKTPATGKTGDPADRNKIYKKRTGKKNRSVKIYPGLVKKTMHVVAREINDSPVDFYVFGIDGTLMVNYRLHPGEHVKLNELERGSYIYQVFDGDEMSETGKLEIK